MLERRWLNGITQFTNRVSKSFPVLKHSSSRSNRLPPNLMKFLSFLFKEKNADQHLTKSDITLFEEKYAEFYKEARAYVRRNLDCIAREYAEDRLDRFYDELDEAREQAKLAKTECNEERCAAEKMDDRRARTETFLAKMTIAKGATRDIDKNIPTRSNRAEPDLEPG